MKNKFVKTIIPVAYLAASSLFPSFGAKANENNDQDSIQKDNIKTIVSDSVPSSLDSTYIDETVFVHGVPGSLVDNTFGQQLVIDAYNNNTFSPSGITHVNFEKVPNSDKYVAEFSGTFMGQDTVSNDFRIELTKKALENMRSLLGEEKFNLLYNCKDIKCPENVVEVKGKKGNPIQLRSSIGPNFNEYGSSINATLGIGLDTKFGNFFIDYVSGDLSGGYDLLNESKETTRVQSSPTGILEVHTKTAHDASIDQTLGHGFQVGYALPLGKSWHLNLSGGVQNRLTEISSHSYETGKPIFNTLTNTFQGEENASLYDYEVKTSSVSDKISFGKIGVSKEFKNGLEIGLNYKRSFDASNATYNTDFDENKFDLKNSSVSAKDINGLNLEVIYHIK